jgi:tRNA-dihydrouridine synthase C
MAENAARLAALGPEGIDLNFGCPAKVVNRHGGGAALLDDPELIFRIVHAVRRSVPAHLPVSAKMRLGFNDDSRAEECAQAMEAGGACELVVHARTKADAYRPPAYWERIADVRGAVKVPVVANGEIWTVDDALRCRSISGCEDLMLGRGIVTDPGLAWNIRAAVAPPETPASIVSWDSMLPLVGDFWQLVCLHLEPRQQAGRLKQWLNFLRHRYPQAQEMYQSVCTLYDRRAVDQWLHVQGYDSLTSADHCAPATAPLP